MFDYQVYLLKKVGLKVTAQRKIILHVLQNKFVNHHFTVEDLYLQYSDTKPTNKKIGLASIYRILSDFTEAKIIQRSCFFGGKFFFELTSDSKWHLHLINELTGEITEIRDSEVLNSLSLLIMRKGYNISNQGATVYVNKTP